MFTVITVIALAALASGSYIGNPVVDTSMSNVNPRFTNKIVGGHVTDIGSVPYQVSLQIGPTHICGGSIIGPRHVLTAGHCVFGDWDDYDVRIGSTLNSMGGQYIHVDQIIVHPDYDADDNWLNDIAVLVLSKEIVFGENVRAVNLPRQGAPLPVGQYAVASGWGALSEGGISPVQLQSVAIPINDPEVCESAYGNKFKRQVMVCAASTVGGHSTCQGDSGGPLVHDGVQWGIVSWATGCARPNYPTVFAHVSNLRSFITDVAGI